MNYAFHPGAEAELVSAADYYESHGTGLGRDFTTEIRNCVQRILDLPDAWPELEPDIRCCLARRFPYGVLYTQYEGAILILAVMHLHRRPGYWEDRVPKK